MRLLALSVVIVHLVMAFYSLNSVSGFSRPLQWSRGAGDDGMSTPAVDASNVYHHSGTSLEIWNRFSGLPVASIPDPFASAFAYSYHGAPMIGSRANVVAFAGAFSGRAGSNIEQYEQRVFSSFNIRAKTFEWATADAYITAPALANGVIYAARNDPMVLDAISEATGNVLWSWSPTGRGDTSFHRNVIVTNNLLFVSTDRAVYALDLATKKPVWNYPQPGMLALSANHV
ncbi:MAG: PQQ-binding-like beta-propeller repeat protein, partial [Gammaproteobacteria bacterium]|nr:PQQ-binding-like beta-propeller repeat protein [Gammaproteobacteria bacterium]